MNSRRAKDPSFDDLDAEIEGEWLSGFEYTRPSYNFSDAPLTDNLPEKAALWASCTAATAPLERVRLILQTQVCSESLCWFSSARVTLTSPLIESFFRCCGLRFLFKIFWISPILERSTNKRCFSFGLRTFLWHAHRVHSVPRAASASTITANGTHWKSDAERKRGISTTSLTFFF